MILHTFANTDLGIEARVAKSIYGFAVSVLDTDAELIVPMLQMFKTEAAAIDCAKKAAA